MSEDFTKNGVPWNVRAVKADGRWRASLSWLLPSGSGGWSQIWLDVDAKPDAEAGELWSAIRTAASGTGRMLPIDPNAPLDPAEGFPGPRHLDDGSIEWGGPLPP